MIKHSQITQSNKFAISLQYLKKEVKNGVHFLHADKHQSFYKMALSFLMEVVRHVQSTQNRKLVIFLEYIKKKVLQQLLGSILMQNIQIFHGGSVMFVVNCSFRIFTWFCFTFLSYSPCDWDQFGIKSGGKHVTHQKLGTYISKRIFMLNYFLPSSTENTKPKPFLTY